MTGSEVLVLPRGSGTHKKWEEPGREELLETGSGTASRVSWGRGFRWRGKCRDRKWGQGNPGEGLCWVIGSIGAGLPVLMKR